MTTLRSSVRLLVAAASLFGIASQAVAVEGGTGAYLPGSRDTFAGIAPPPGSYFTIDLFSLESTAPSLADNGLLLLDVASNATVTKFNLTHAFDTSLWGGQPYVTVTLPHVAGSLSFAGELKNGVAGGFTDDQSGLGDLTITPALGYHSGKHRWVYGASIFAPTGYYEPATFNIAARDASVLNFGKNRWAIAPTLAYTYLDMDTGVELSASGSATFSQRNDATNYQTATEIVVEMAALQHLPSGLAFGLTGYVYQQTGDDTGSGADAVRNVTNAESLQASLQGIGPIITYSKKIGDRTVSMKLKYISEMNARRRFESDVAVASFTVAF